MQGRNRKCSRQNQKEWKWKAPRKSTLIPFACYVHLSMHSRNVYLRFIICHPFADLVGRMAVAGVRKCPQYASPRHGRPDSMCVEGTKPWLPISALAERWRWNGEN